MKRILITLLIIALVLMIPSCKKKTSEDSSTSTSAVTASVSSSSAEVDSTTESSSSFRTLDEPKSLTVAGESDSSSSGEILPFMPTPVETAEKPETAETSELSETSEDTETTVTSEPLVDISSVEVEKPLVYVNEAETDSSSFTLNEFYRGGELLIKASFTPTSGELVFSTDEAEVKQILKSLSVNYSDYGEISYTLTGSLLEITYPLATEEEVEAKWQNFKDFLNSYNEEKASLVEADDNELVVSKSEETVKGTLNASIYSDRVEITVPGNMTEEETSAFITWIVTSYPEAVEYGTYTVSDGVVTLVYSELFSNRLASAVFDDLVYLINSYFAESASEEAAPETAKPAAATSVDEKISAEKVSAEAEKKESFIKGYSVSGYLTPSFNFEKSSFNFGAGLRAEIDFKSWLSAGLSAGGNFYGYLDALLYGRFTFVGFGKLDIYGLAGVGVDWSIKGGQAGLMLRAAVGVEYAVLEKLSVFGEIGYQYSALRKSDIYASVGVSYRF